MCNRVQRKLIRLRAKGLRRLVFWLALSVSFKIALFLGGSWLYFYAIIVVFLSMPLGLFVQLLAIVVDIPEHLRIPDQLYVVLFFLVMDFQYFVIIPAVEKKFPVLGRFFGQREQDP